MRKKYTISISPETAASLRMLYALTGKSEQVIVADLVKNEIGRITQNMTPNDSFAAIAQSAVSSLNPTIDDTLPVFITSFINDCCTVDAKAKILSSTLYQSYVDYCEKMNQPASSIIVFTNYLQSSGFKRRRSAKGSYRIGIRLKTDLPV